MKKRLLSLFVVFSMLVSILAIPTSVSADALDAIKNVNMTHNGNGQYTVTFDFNSDSYGTDTVYFQVFSRAWVIEQGGGDTSTTIGDAMEGSNFKANSFSSDPGYGTTISTLVRLDDTTGNGCTFNFSLSPTVYNTLGAEETTTYYLYMNSDKTSEAHTEFTITSTGDVQKPQVTLTLDPNGGTIGGSSTPPTVQIPVGTYTADKLTELIYTKIDSISNLGNKLLGWASTAQAAAAESLTVNEGDTPTLYAVWKEKDNLGNGDFEITTPVTYDGDENPVEFKTCPIKADERNSIHVKYNGNTDIPVNQGTYEITISVDETDDYKATTTDLNLGNYVIQPADYIYEEALTKTVAIGTDTTQQQEIEGSVTDVKGNSVPGKFTASGSKSSIAAGETENVVWTFAPTAPDANGNYNTFTKQGTITANNKTDKAATLTIPSDVEYDGQPHAADASVEGLTKDTDFEVQYKKNGADTYTNQPPTAAGTYDVKVVLKGNNENLYNLTGTATGILEIKQRELTVASGAAVTKPYDATTQAKINGNNLAVSDLVLGNKAGSDDVSLTGTIDAQYDNENAGTEKNIEISGLSLDGAAKDNYKLPQTITVTGDITSKTITAALKADKSSKVYGTEIELKAEDFDITGFEGADTVSSLTDLDFASEAEAKTANVNAEGYAVTAAQKNTNYNITCTGKIAVTQADYTAPSAVEGTIGIGDEIVNHAVTGKVTDVNGNDVTGKFVITSADKGNAEAGQVYDNLVWKFVPDTADANYKELTGTNGKLTATDKTAKNAALTVPEKVIAGADYTVNAAVEDLTEGTDFKVQYSVKGADSFVDEKPAAVGEYDVKIVLLPQAEALYTLTGTTTAAFEIISGYKIFVADTENGTFTYTVNGGQAVSGETTAVMDGAEVEITAAPASNYKLNKITVTKADDTAVTVTNNKFTMPASDVTIAVTFAKKSSGGGGGVSSYTVKYDVGENGKITSGKASESVVSSAKPKNVPEVTANDGYKFVGWSQDGTTIVDPTTVSVTKAITFTALYEEAVTATPTPAPTAEPQGDTDNHEHYINGYEDGTFRADGQITRAEVATIFALALSDYDAAQTYENVYPDLAADAWYTNYISYLSGIGAITGYEDGTFRAENYITRQEFATMIARLGEVLEAGDMPFADVSEENWGVDYIYTTYANGWVSGYEDGTFRPENPITRAEAVKIVNGYLGRGTDAAGLADADYTVFPDIKTAHWAYFDIIEAANDHSFTKDTMPEIWID